PFFLKKKKNSPFLKFLFIHLVCIIKSESCQQNKIFIIRKIRYSIVLVVRFFIIIVRLERKKYLIDNLTHSAWHQMW
ncbi:hypothetical protein GLOIN_2v1731379, partial [Rhizophagus irregularis DAOM 181602=DAOM 197198]